MLYAEDKYENIGASKTIAFTVSIPEQSPQIPILAVSVTVGVITIGSLLI